MPDRSRPLFTGRPLYIRAESGFVTLQVNARTSPPTPPARNPFASATAAFNKLFLRDGEDMRKTGNWYRATRQRD